MTDQPATLPASSLCAPSRIDTDLPIRAIHHIHSTRRDMLFDMHYGLELGIIRQGRMRRSFAGWQFDAAAGDVWLCGMWEPHGWQVLQTPCDTVVVVVSPEVLTQFRIDDAPQIDWLAPFAAPPPDRPKASRTIRKGIRDCADRLVQAIAEPAEQPIGDWWLRVLLLEVLLILRQDQPGPPARPNSAGRSLGRINNAIEAVLSSQQLVTTAHAAALCGMNRKAFSRVFREMMGVRFSEFDLRHRISGCATQLLRTSDPIKKIAADWGFTDASHMHHCFMRFARCSPATFRRQAVSY
jgi:AraC-like DNA-binding protein